MRLDLESASTRQLALLLLAGCLAAYLNSFAGQPQFDDYAVIVEDSRVASLSAWWQSMPGIRPLLKLSYALNNSVGGLFGFHLLNLAIHAANVLLVWRLLLRLLPAEPARVAWYAALLFALHPVNSEAVMLLSGRSVSLAALGMLGSLLALLDARPLLSLLFFALALGVRETALALPALALLCHAWIGLQGRARSPSTALREALHATRWHWLVAIAGTALLLALPRYRELLAFSLATRAPLDNLVTQAGATLYLLGQLLQPFASNSDPRLPVFEGWNLHWAAACALWGVALAWSGARLARGSWAAFAVAWFVLAIAPTNSLVARLDVANERQLYLAALPLFAGVVLLLERNLGSGLIFGTKIGPDPTFRDPRFRGARAITLLVLLTLLLAATVLRNRDYRSEVAFWEAVLARDDGNARAWNNLGYALELERPGAIEAALAAYRRAIALDPADYKAQLNLRQLCARRSAEVACHGPEREGGGL